MPLPADPVAAQGWLPSSFLDTAHFYDAIVAWLHREILVPSSFAQLAVTIVIVAMFLVAVRPLRRALIGRADRISTGAVRQIALPLAETAPWLILALAWWFAAVVFADGGYGNGLIRLAGSLTLAWIVIKLSSRLVRSESLARMFAVSAFVIAALNIAGLIHPVVDLLDSMAITVGTLRVSLLLLIKGALTLALLLWIAGTLSRIADSRLARVRDLTPAMQVLTSKLLHFALLTLAIVVALGSVGIDLTAFAVFSGAIGVGIGFGLQKVVSNLVSGVILLIDRSIKPGDVIETDGTYGWITSLNARYVSVATRDGKEILIPNEELITGRVVNWSFSNLLIRQRVTVGIAYGSDVHLAMRVALEAVAAVPRALAEPKPTCLLADFGDSSVNLEIRFWINDPDHGTQNARSDVRLQIWDRFHAHGIEFPFPQRDLNLRNPEALAAALRQAGKTTAPPPGRDDPAAAPGSAPGRPSSGQ